MARNVSGATGRTQSQMIRSERASTGIYGWKERQRDGKIKMEKKWARDIKERKDQRERESKSRLFDLLGCC